MSSNTYRIKIRDICPRAFHIIRHTPHSSHYVLLSSIIWSCNSIIYLDGQILIKLQFSVKLYGRQRLISILHLCPISRLMSAISVVTLPPTRSHKLVMSKITFLILGRVLFVYNIVYKFVLFIKSVDSLFKLILSLRISLTITVKNKYLFQVE